MKRIERILLKIVIVQFLFLLLAQCLILYTPFAPYVAKVYEYEGVIKQEKTKTIETTVDQP
ncbi:YpfB family protein [Anoxybacillus sp. J5B_2022]|uniref:YpfB family protein n=1 Tax=Anoxybacillus sp. J5B_2022 TaxID=3003246 RepID=UPI0022861378|nr:YpfB family protein [Anoxybacillus sp. J5B_2022]MCZ0754417.1 YpfB family protein [Anoxybacillus sp. J5B_2022]